MLIPTKYLVCLKKKKRTYIGFISLLSSHTQLASVLRFTISRNILNAHWNPTTKSCKLLSKNMIQIKLSFSCFDQIFSNMRRSVMIIPPCLSAGMRIAERWEGRYKSVRFEFFTEEGPKFFSKTRNHWVTCFKTDSPHTIGRMYYSGHQRFMTTIPALLKGQLYNCTTLKKKEKLAQCFTLRHISSSWKRGPYKNLDFFPIWLNHQDIIHDTHDHSWNNKQHGH